ncbi:unnamed protein product [Rotaria sp. Silwood1]|nr:unnamed protein product [Rotaria sp. Silwood1]CAF0859991.1 unnamed protein product [Rotaria sp. Silwood1]CAF3355461.1 unnamed protein product [Rotaria sp. Silwood1]CAF3379239.1 unnamed protein product [Rotaria sp. Silwood1]CAF4728695.1 unnamed protein product [Rotaria sp. Silwood1]
MKVHWSEYKSETNTIKLIMFRCSRIFIHRRLLIICIIISCIISFKHFLIVSSLLDKQSINHKSVVYNASDPFVMTNLIDQFLHTTDYNERDQLWSLVVQSWSKSFELYLKRTKTICSLSSSSLLSFEFIDQYLNQYTKKLLVDNIDFQRRLTAFGLFFDYNVKDIRSKNHHILHNMYLSSCTYFELIVLIMKVQYVLLELNIDYFIGQNTLLGALRHHDIVPWHSIVEFNLPLLSKAKFIENINKNFQLVLQQVNNAYINKKQNGFIYKVFTADKSWPQIEIYFYQENSTHIFDSYNNNHLNMKIGYLQKNDVFPFQFRPFGPILIHSIRNPYAMISLPKLNICENLAWNHRLEKATDTDHQRRIPCEQLYKIYSFVQSRQSWRRGYCEETLKTKRVPHRTLSYFRCICQESIAH